CYLSLCLCVSLFVFCRPLRVLRSFPTRRSSDLRSVPAGGLGPLVVLPAHRSRCRVPALLSQPAPRRWQPGNRSPARAAAKVARRSEEHTSELQSRENLVCRLLLEKKKKKRKHSI